MSCVGVPLVTSGAAGPAAGGLCGVASGDTGGCGLGAGLFIAFVIFLGEIGNPKRGNGLEGGSGVRPATSWAGATVAESRDQGE